MSYSLHGQTLAQVVRTSSKLKGEGPGQAHTTQLRNQVFNMLTFVCIAPLKKNHHRRYRICCSFRTVTLRMACCEQLIGVKIARRFHSKALGVIPSQTCV